MYYENCSPDEAAFRQCHQYGTGYPPSQPSDLRQINRLRALEARLLQGLNEQSRAQYDAFRLEAQRYLYQCSRYYFLRGFQAGLLDYPNWDMEDG